MFLTRAPLVHTLNIFIFMLFFAFVSGMQCLFSRINITDRQVSMLKQYCSDFGYVVPVHTMEMKGMYGLGLGMNSMEGREAKHIAISRYCKNTAYLYQWEQVFRHEYISLIWLREKGYNIKNTSFNSRNLSYLPKRVKDSDEYCKCGLGKIASTDDHCRICSHELRKKSRLVLRKGRFLSKGCFPLQHFIDGCPVRME